MGVEARIGPAQDGLLQRRTSLKTSISVGNIMGKLQFGSWELV
jgi:hypothetical protein